MKKKITQVMKGLLGSEEIDPRVLRIREDYPEFEDFGTVSKCPMEYIPKEEIYLQMHHMQEALASLFGVEPAMIALDKHLHDRFIYGDKTVTAKHSGSNVTSISFTPGIEVLEEMSLNGVTYVLYMYGHTKLS